MNKFKIIGNVFYVMVITFLALVAVGTAFSVLQAPGGLRLFVVMSGSMEPKISTASVVIVTPAKSYQKGDVITFFANPTQRDLKKSGTTVTHRIIEVSNDEGRATYQTKGDANEDPDREMVTQAAVLGKVLFSIPFLGRVIAFTKTQIGFITVIVIPATLIVYSEILNIIKEIKAMISRKKSQKAIINKDKMLDETEKIDNNAKNTKIVTDTKKSNKKVKIPEIKKTGRKFHKGQT